VISQVFSTGMDNQTSVQIHLLQGDSEFADKNRSLSKLIFEVNPTGPKAVPQIDITFSVSLSGELKISAKNLETKKVQDFPSIFLSVI
jgi:molecular chaperone DnaK